MRQTKPEAVRFADVIGIFLRGRPYTRDERGDLQQFHILDTRAGRLRRRELDCVAEGRVRRLERARLHVKQHEIVYGSGRYVLDSNANRRAVRVVVWDEAEWGTSGS